MVLTGKGYGTTNLIALDRKGNALMEKIVQVLDPQQDVVVVFRGVNRETYSCAPLCNPTITLGDFQQFFAQNLAQTSTRSSQASAIGTRRASKRKAASRHWFQFVNANAHVCAGSTQHFNNALSLRRHPAAGCLRPAMRVIAMLIFAIAIRAGASPRRASADCSPLSAPQGWRRGGRIRDGGGAVSGADVCDSGDRRSSSSPDRRLKPPPPTPRD